MSQEFERTDSLPTRPSLLGRLTDLRDDRSWRDFCTAYEARIVRIAERRGLQQADAQDVAQEVLRRVAQTIHEYKHNGRRGAFRSWLFQLARWRASDRLRQRSRDDLMPGLFGWREPPSDREPAPDPVEQLSSDPEIHRQVEMEAQRHLIETLLARVQHSVSRRNLQIFQMVMLDGVDVPRVAELFHTRPSAIYVINHRVLAKLRTEVAALGPFIE